LNNWPNLSTVSHLVDSPIDDDRIELIGQRTWRISNFPGRLGLSTLVLTCLFDLYIDLLGDPVEWDTWSGLSQSELE
jgi:hypothetical protein